MIGHRVRKPTKKGGDTMERLNDAIPGEPGEYVCPWVDICVIDYDPCQVIDICGIDYHNSV